MRIATWNINSVRLRQAMVLHFLQTHQPDVLCLQETKTPDAFFPAQLFAAQGYRHQHIHGMKSYNGVAILSRLALAECGIQHWAGKQDCRHIYATLAEGTAQGTQIHCLYVPAGGDIPDTALNEKFAHKLQLLEEMRAWWAARTAQQDHTAKIMLGDFNIAPLAQDVWSHQQLLDVVSHTPIEVASLTALQASHHWHDAVRHFIPASQKLYSWWSYRAKDWQHSNRGRRLDHIWVTPQLVPRLHHAFILSEARSWQPKPSDHVPVVVDIV